MLAYTIGIMSLVVILYRIIFLMVPMLREGLRLGNMLKVFESFTLLV